MKKLILDIESTLNQKILVTKYTAQPKGVIGFITPKIEPEKRSFEDYNEFSKWLQTELGGL